MLSALFFLKNIVLEVPAEVSFPDWRETLYGRGAGSEVYGPALTVYNGKPIILRECGLMGIYSLQERHPTVKMTLREVLEMEEIVKEIVE